MSAGDEIQAAIIAALQSVTELTGIYDGPPARAAYPYAVIDASSEMDWSHKTGGGREIPVAVTVWDDQPARLRLLSEKVESCVMTVSQLERWQLVALRFQRKRILRDVAGPWAAAIDFRARMLRTA